MAKGDLFCIKTKNGYGLFQQIEEKFTSNFNFHLIYYTQIADCAIENINLALNGDYYYHRMFFDGFDLEKIKENRNIEFTAKSDCLNYVGCRNCFLTYLGNFPLPKNSQLPRYTRNLDISYFTGKHSWFISDEVNHDLIRKDNGNPYHFKTLIPEIEKLPRFSSIPPETLLKYFDNGYRPEQDDIWVEKHIEEFYLENPHMRPTDIKYEEVRLPLPVDNLRNCLENPENETEYLKFCDRLEEALKKFINSLDENKKSVQKPLIMLIKELNRIEKETELIGSMESEEIYGYIVKILRSLKKARLIETLEAYREW